jgi:hypothetical protein
MMSRWNPPLRESQRERETPKLQFGVWVFRPPPRGPRGGGPEEEDQEPRGGGPGAQRRRSRSPEEEFQDPRGGGPGSRV